MKKRNSKTILAETLLELARYQTLDKITVKQIVEESGLSMQTFYNHFQDKSELILYIHKSEGDKNMDALRKGQISFTDMARKNLDFYLEHKDYMANAISNSPASNPYLRQIADTTLAVMEHYFQNQLGLDPIPEEIDFDLRMYVNALVALYGDLALGRLSMPNEKFLDYLHNGMPPKLRTYLLP